MMTVIPAQFLDQRLGIQGKRSAESIARRLRQHTAEHLYLVGVSLSAAIALAIPLGILSARRRLLGQVILGFTGLVQTIPSLALLVFMIPLVGIGGPPAILALAQRLRLVELPLASPVILAGSRPQRSSMSVRPRLAH